MLEFIQFWTFSFIDFYLAIYWLILVRLRLSSQQKILRSDIFENFCEIRNWTKLSNSKKPFEKIWSDWKRTLEKFSMQLKSCSHFQPRSELSNLNGNFNFKLNISNIELFNFFSTKCNLRTFVGIKSESSH